MAQLTIYLDGETRRRIEETARRAGVSVSQWVKERLARALEAGWPEGYFDLLGSVPAGDLVEPAELDPELDSPRSDPAP